MPARFVDLDRQTPTTTRITTRSARFAPPTSRRAKEMAAAQQADYQAKRAKRQARRTGLIVTWILVLAFSVGGEEVVRLLGQHWGWNGRTFFSAMAWFWWLYAMVITTWIIATYRRTQAIREPETAAGESPLPATAPIWSRHCGASPTGSHGDDSTAHSGPGNLGWSAPRPDQTKTQRALRASLFYLVRQKSWHIVCLWRARLHALVSS